MLFDGVLIAGRVQEDAARASETLYMRDLARGLNAAERLRAKPGAYLECLLEPELLGEFEDTFEIFHTTEPVKFAISQVHGSEKSLPTLDAAFRFELVMVQQPDTPDRLEIPKKINLANAVNLYWKCHSDLESIAVDVCEHKLLRPRA